MSAIEKLKTKFDEVTAEVDSLLAQTKGMREEREALNKEAVEIRERVVSMTRKIQAVHGSDLRRLKKQRAEIATALQSVREADKLASELD